MIDKYHRNTIFSKTRLALLVSICLVALVLFLQTITFDVGVHRNKISSLISKNTGHEMHIDGAIGLKASLRPHFIAENIRIPNPDWSLVPDALKVRRLEVQIALLPLIIKKVRIIKMNLSGMYIHIEYDSRSKANWRVVKQGIEKTSNSYFLDKLSMNIKDSKVVWHRKGRSPIVLSVNGVDAILGINDPLQVEGITKFNETSLNFNFSGGKLDHLWSQKTPWPFQGTVFINNKPIEFEGNILYPITLKGARLQLSTDISTLTSMLPIDYHENEIGRLGVDIDMNQNASGYNISLSSNISNLDLADLNIDFRVSENKNRIIGSANASFKQMERFGALFGSKWIPLGPVEASGNFILNDNLLKIEPLKGNFAGSTLQGKLSLGFREPFKTSLNLQTKAFDVGNILALKKPDTTVSIRANDVKVSSTSNGKTVLSSILNSNWMLESPAGHLRWQSSSKKEYSEIGISNIKISSQLNRSIDIGLFANYYQSEFRLNGKLGSLVKLAHRKKAYPIDLKIDESCSISGEFVGVLKKPLRNHHVAGKAAIQAERATSLAKLFEYDWEWDLPFELSGQLDTNFDKILLNDYTLQMDGMHFEGDVTYFPDKSPKANLLVKDGKIDLKKYIKPSDETNTPGSVGENKPKPKRIIPDVFLNSEKIAPLSMAVQFDNFKVMYDKEPITSFNANLSIINSILKIMPYEGVSYGNATSQASLILDFSTLPATTTFVLAMDGLDYGNILENLKISNKVVGKMDIKANLKGHGSHLRELLGNANGKLEIVADKGKMPKRILELWGGSLVRLLIPTIWFEKDETDLNCGVYQFDINDGLLESNLMLVDTERVTVAGEVALDFKTEEIAALFKPKNKKAVLLKLGTPIKLSGTLAHIKAESAESSIVTFGKLILGLSHPSTTILLYGDIGKTDQNPCEALLYHNLPEK